MTIAYNYYGVNNLNKSICTVEPPIEQRTLWDQYMNPSVSLQIERSSSSQRFKMYIGKPIIWDLEKCPLLRGLLYCVPIILEVLL